MHVTPGWPGGGPTPWPAHRAVFVEAANQPELAGEIARARETLTSTLAPVLAALSEPEPEPEPERHVPHLLALMAAGVVEKATTGAARTEWRRKI